MCVREREVLLPSVFGRGSVYGFLCIYVLGVLCTLCVIMFVYLSFCVCVCVCVCEIGRASCRERV